MDIIDVILNKISRLPERKEGLFLVLCLSTILKTLLLIFLSDETINSDGVLYISAAQEFALGHFSEGLSIYPMPLYPLLIALGHFFVPHWLLAARLISFATLVLALIPLYLLTQDLFDRKAAFWGCLTLTLAPMNNGWTLLVYRGPCFLFIFAWAVFFAQRALRSKQLIDFLAAAFLTWLSILVRIEGIVCILVYLLFLIVMALVKPQERGSYFKGVFVWIALPLFLLAVVYVAPMPEIKSFNRIKEVTETIQNFFNLKFLQNYHEIYGQLEAMEERSPAPGQNQNFGEIARHFMAIIYLLGLLQTYIKVLFPLYVIPLYLSLRHTVLREAQLFVMLLVAAYLLMVYYFLIDKDFLERRFLFAPVFLSYPWIGDGLKRIWIYLKQSSHSKLFLPVFVMAFLLSPIYKYTQLYEKHDNLNNIAGAWLGKSDFQDARIITNEREIPFLAGRKIYTEQKQDCILYDNKNRDLSDIERVALANQMDLIVIKTKVKRKDLLPKFTSYNKIKEFVGKRKLIVIYGSREFSKFHPYQTD